MARRELTPEEKLLWRTVTSRDKKLRPEAPVEESEVSALPAPRPPKKPASAPALPPKPKALPPLAPLSAREAKKRLKPFAEIEATLDLHGLGRSEAYERLLRFLAASCKKHLRHVLIITGKGRTGEGILRTALPHWLNEPKLREHVAAIAPARAEKGGSGALHVLLRKQR